MKKYLFVIGIVFIILVSAFFVGRNSDTQIKPVAQGEKPQQQTSQVTFDKTKYSTTKPGSIWWIVNKQRAAGASYAPTDLVVPNVPVRPSAGADERKLRKEAAGGLEALVAAAKKENINLMLASGYRSYQTQVTVYNNEVKQYGQAKADTQSAKPGYSEHQTGLAMDVEDGARKCEVSDCFGTLPEGKWVAANAYKYGFIVRYTPGKESITGYRAEPWHIRYICTELSNEMHKQNISTLEEFFSN